MKDCIYVCDMLGFEKKAQEMIKTIISKKTIKPTKIISIKTAQSF